jgi:hypothetical protein
MVFYGRSLDTFESAIAMLMNEEPPLQYVDCVAGRSFTFCRESGAELYSCALTDAEAVENLNRNIGNVLAIVSPFNLFEPFVIQIQTDIGIPTIVRKYYPKGHYVLCHRKGGTLNIHDPDGFPQLSFSVEAFDWGGQPAVIRTGLKPTAEINLAIVLQDGFELKKHTQPVHHNLSRIFLQYAIRNYICQTNKVVSLLSEYTTIPLDAQNELEFLFSNMLTGSTDKLEYVFVQDANIWMVLEDLWRSKR